MARTHGPLNAFGFVLAGLVGWALHPARPAPRGAAAGIPFSRLRSRGRVGRDFFAQAASAAEAPAGVVPDLDAYRRADFDTTRVHPSVRAFYERTGGLGLNVRAHWTAGFRLGGRLVSAIGARVGQLALPVAGAGEARVESALTAVSEALDGRPGVRGWVRTYAGSPRPMYVAAYAEHTQGDVTFMNIAFPLPGGNMTSILHARPYGSDAQGCTGVELTTLPGAAPAGDQGVYLATPLFTLRLPLDETIEVWAEGPGHGGAVAPVRAAHRMWLCGIRFLTLDYEIHASGQ